MELLLILVKSPQVCPLDPQKYLGVVLVVVLVVADADAPNFSGRPHARILSLLFNQYFVVILVESADARCAVLIDSGQMGAPVCCYNNQAGPRFGSSGSLVESK